MNMDEYGGKHVPMARAARSILAAADLSLMQAFKSGPEAREVELARAFINLYNDYTKAKRELDSVYTILTYAKQKLED